MTSSKSEFEFLHEALQDRDTIARYVHAIADGIASGTLRLSNDQREVELHPHALVGFELWANRERGRGRLRLRLNWREEPSSSEPSEGLLISSE